MTSFAKNLRRLRNERGITQEELAKLTGISRSRINNYENDAREPDFETLEVFADTFNVDFNTLLGEAEMLDDQEQALVAYFRQLNYDGRIASLAILKGLTETAQYRIAQT